MADILDNDETDKTPLLKEKKLRAPPSEKQKENFLKMAAKRAENIKKRKEEKLFEAQKALVEKHCSVLIKKEEAPKKLKEKVKETVQFEIDEISSEEEEQLIPEPIKKKNIKAPPPVPVVTPAQKIKKQIKPQPIIEESETDYSSDSSEEIIVIKRGKKKAKPIQKQKQQKQQEVEEEEYVAEVERPAPNFINYFC